MADFLLELRSEEIPARMQARAREDLAKLFAAELARAGIAADDVTTFSTPRRLTLIARGLPVETAAASEEIKGPKASAPPQALDGFLRKTGLTRDQLVERDGVLFAVIDKPGRATADVLAEAIPAIIRAFPWPKSMRWGAASLSTESLKWVRPLQGIVALFGDDIVACEIAGIVSGRETMGHRFHSTGAISIRNAATYADQLRAAHVIVDQEERESIIALGATRLAAEAGLTLIRDEGLLAENAGLTEWPVPLLGRFGEAYLSVPPEVIQLTARVNQKYFVCSSPLPLVEGAGSGPDADGPTPNPSRKREGSLANAFICTANIDAADGGAAIVNGNRKVLAARLSDAKFFYETDLKVPLEEQAKKLDRIVFHEKLGTVADKVARVAKLARWLVEEGIVTESPSRLREGLGVGLARSGSLAESSGPPPTPPASGRGDLAALAERAAQLCKADLVTGMVGEFPELQGVMGGYYAAAQGEDPRVAAAIRDHYKPVGQGDEVPTDPVTVAVSLADKLDTVFSFFAIEERPTGSKDPFALRRAIIGVAQLVILNELRLPLRRAFALAHLAWFEGAIRKSRHDAWIDLKESEYRTGALDLLRVRLINDYLEFAPIDLTRSFSELFDLWNEQARDWVPEFAADRLKVQQREAGVRHDLIDAVFALGGEDDLVRLLARVHALQAFIGTEDGANLLAGYKRAANILKKEGVASPSPLPLAGGAGGGPDLATNAPTEDTPTPNPSREREGNFGLAYSPEPAEAALIAALGAAAPAAADAIAHEDFEAAMAALASLRAPIDAFFETVIVNDPDPTKRAARLELLEKIRDAIHSVADFSKIEG